MGTTLPINQLTIAELHEVAEAAGLKDVPEKPKPKVVEAVADGLNDEQAQAALVKYGYAEPPAPPASNDTSSDDTSTTAPTGDAPAAPTGANDDTTDAAGDADDLDEYETEGDAPAAPAGNLPQLEERHLPVLKKAGASIRRITRHHDGNGGEDPGTWWCPFTDASKLKEGEAVDQMPQSRAIRVVTSKTEPKPRGRGERNVEYAVVLPPGGVPAGALR